MDWRAAQRHMVEDRAPVRRVGWPEEDSVISMDGVLRVRRSYADTDEELPQADMDADDWMLAVPKKGA